MKEKPMIVYDWRQGYAILDTMRHSPYTIAFATPHSMISEPRMGEYNQLKMTYISKKREFQSQEELDLFIRRITKEPDFLDTELQKYHPTEEEMHYFKYKDLLTKAYECRGVSAMKYILSSLLYTYKPIDAYLWIGNRIPVSIDERDLLFRKACLMAEYEKREYERPEDPASRMWTDHWFRPAMRGIASYHTYQLELPEDKTLEEEAVKKLQELIELDIDDPMGLRFILMNHWYWNDQFQEMQAIYNRFPADHNNPLFVYPMAFLQFRTLGEASLETASFARKAFESNMYIPLILFQELESKPFYKPYYLPGTKDEADYFFTLYSDLHGMAEEQMKWLYSSLQNYIETISPKTERATA